MPRMLFTVDGREMETLSEIDCPGIESLCRECTDYWTLVTGRVASKADAASLLTDRPPKLALSNKLVLGLRDGRRLVAIVDALRDYPGKGTWWLGLLLITPELRGGGLGRRLYAALESWSATQGARELRLCVQAQNTRAHKFWQHLGFVALTSQTVTLHGLASDVTTYGRSVSVGVDGAALPCCPSFDRPLPGGAGVVPPGHSSVLPICVQRLHGVSPGDIAARPERASTFSRL